MLIFVFFIPENFAHSFKKMPKRSKPTDEEWDVEDILDSRVNSELLRTEFLIKWKKWDPEYNSWEPLDNIYKCPVFLKELEKKKRKQLVAKKKRSSPSVTEETLESLGNFEKIDDTILEKFKDPWEFIPKGNEAVNSIWKEEISPQGNYLWFMTFKNDPRPCYVRKCVVAYYWPYHAAMFLHLQVSRFEKTITCEDKIESKRLKK